MLLLDAIVALVAIGCATAIATMVIGKVGGGRQGALQDELRRARDQIAYLEQRNSHLEQQVEWQTRFLRVLEEQRRGSGDPPLLADGPPLAASDEPVER
jgi:hypothetical protein